MHFPSIPPSEVQGSSVNSTGNNRLGGNSLLDCVVFGRVSGKHCAEYMLGEIKPTSLAQLSGKFAAGKAAP